MDVIIHTQVYNGKKTLRRTVDSVLQQTYPDFLYIISDNASTDGTRDIIKEYAKKDKRIITQYNKVNEFYAYLDVVSECCKNYPDGYWAMLDADDEYKPEFIERMLRHIEQNNLDIAACGSDYYDDKTFELKDGKLIHESLILTGTDFSERFSDYHRFTRTVWGKLYSLQLLRKCNFDNVRKMSNFGGDTVFALEAFSHANKVGIMPDILHNYYISTSSVTYKWDAKRKDSNVLLDDYKRSFLIANCGEVTQKNDKFLQFVYFNDCQHMFLILLSVSMEYYEKTATILDILNENKTKAAFCNPNVVELMLTDVQSMLLTWLLTQKETRTSKGAVIAAEIVEVVYNGSYINHPLLSNVSESNISYLIIVIIAVLTDNLQAALDEIIRLSEDDIPDEHVESYLVLASNICAVNEYAEGWLLFQNEYARFLSDTGRKDEAEVIFKDLEGF